MTIKTINFLRDLIRTNDDRLASISRRLNLLKELALSPRGPALADSIRKEVAELGEEVDRLTAANKSFKRQINDFFKPAA